MKLRRATTITPQRATVTWASMPMPRKHIRTPGNNLVMQQGITRARANMGVQRPRIQGPLRATGVRRIATQSWASMATKRQHVLAPADTWGTRQLIQGPSAPANTTGVPLNSMNTRQHFTFGMGTCIAQRSPMSMPPSTGGMWQSIMPI